MDSSSSAAGRQRASSGVSLRPFAAGVASGHPAHSLTRMRSRSLLQKEERIPALSSSTPLVSGPSSVDTPAETPTTASSSAGFGFSSNSSDGGDEDDGEDDEDDADTSLSSSSSPQTPVDAQLGSTIMQNTPLAKLPSLPRRFTSLFQGSSASPYIVQANEYDNGKTKPPSLNRQRSFYSLNMPSSPGLSTVHLKGDDEDRKLPSPISHSASDSSSGLAARPISSSTAFLQSLINAPTSSTSSRHARDHTLRTMLGPIMILVTLFVLNLAVIAYLISTIPLKLPHNLLEIRQQSIALREYSRKGIIEGLHVTAVLSAIFVWKQAFSIPGSILVNILFGSLYGTYWATLCACIFTGVGSVFAYYMARLCAPLVERYFPRALSTTRTSLMSGSAADLFSYLLLARLFPLLPYSVLNIACGVLRIPVTPYFITLVLGSFPYNFVTTQLGDLLGSLASSADAGSIGAIWTWDLCFKLAVASVLSAAPIIFKEQLKSFIGGGGKSWGSTSEAGANGIEMNQVEQEKLAELSQVGSSSASHNLRNIPILRRDRTDSTASEVFVGPQQSHKKRWSLSWSRFRNSLSSDSGYASLASQNKDSASPADEESGDTDEEDLREKRFSGIKLNTHTQRRTASIESSSGNFGYSTPSPILPSPQSPDDWGRF